MDRKIIKHCIVHGVAVVLENPANSLFFHVPRLEQLMPKASSNIVFDHCQYDSEFKKSSRLVSWNLNIDCLALRCSNKNGLCSFSNKPHSVLSGKDQNMFKTAAAAAYPRNLTDSLAALLLQHY